MLGRLLILFTVVPVIEIYLLITLGSWMGPVATIALVLTTGALGAWLARREGMRVLREWQGAVERGQLPQEGITSSLLVLVGGVLLVTPGILTDITGFLLLIPPTRRAIAALVSQRVAAQLEVHTVDPSMLGPRPNPASPRKGQFDSWARPASEDVIDIDAAERPASSES